MTAKRVTITVTFDSDDYYLSSDIDEAKETLTQSVHQFVAEFGEIKNVIVSLKGWPTVAKDT